MKKNILTILMLILVSAGLFAQTTFSNNLKFTGAYGSTLEAKLEFGHTIKMPVLQSDGPLFSGNNLKIKGLAGVSPISGTVTVDAVLTPIALMELSLGGGLGTGWDFDLMKLSGLKLGTPLTSDSLGGVYYMGRAGAALQFDTVAIIPGEWSSVVMRTYHEFNYKGYSSATSGVIWEYENGGAMVNGFNYKGEYTLGYKMPLMLNMVAVQLETFTFNIFSGSKGPLFYDLSLIGNLELTSSLNLTIITQFTNIEKAADREIVERAFGFKRVVLMLNYSF